MNEGNDFPEDKPTSKPRLSGNPLAPIYAGREHAGGFPDTPCGVEAVERLEAVRDDDAGKLAVDGRIEALHHA